MDGTDKDKVTGTKPFDKDSRKAVSKHYLPVKLSLCLIPLVLGFLIAFPKNFVIILSLFFVIFFFFQWLMQQARKIKLQSKVYQKNLLLQINILKILICFFLKNLSTKKRIYLMEV